MIAVSEINTFEELANLRVTWRELWEKTPNASFVQSWDWLRSYLRVYGESQQLRTLVVTLRTKPIGILPLVTKQIETRLGNASVLTWPTNSFAPFYGAVGPNPAATLSTGFSYIRKSRRDWNALELPQIDEFGQDNSRTGNALRNARFKPIRTITRPHPVVEMRNRWDDYIASQDPSCHMEFLRSDRAVSRSGPVSFHRWRPEGGMTGSTDRRWDLFQNFEEVHLSVKCSQRTDELQLALIKDAHPAAVDAGAVEICSLTVSGRTAACAYNYRTHGRLENVFIGVREEYGNATLTCLLGHMLRDSFLREDDSIAFQPGDEGRISQWSNATATAVSYGHYAMFSPSAQLLRRQRLAEAKDARPACPETTGQIAETVDTAPVIEVAAESETSAPVETPRLRVFTGA